MVYTYYFPRSVNWLGLDDILIAKSIPSTQMLHPSRKGKMNESRFRGRKAEDAAKCKEVLKE